MSRQREGVALKTRIAMTIALCLAVGCTTTTQTAHYVPYEDNPNREGAIECARTCVEATSTDERLSCIRACPGAREEKTCPATTAPDGEVIGYCEMHSKTEGAGAVYVVLALVAVLVVVIIAGTISNVCDDNPLCGN